MADEPYADPVWLAWQALNPQHPWPTQLGEAGRIRPPRTACAETPARKAVRAKFNSNSAVPTRPGTSVEEKRTYMREYQRRRRAAGEAKGTQAA